MSALSKAYKFIVSTGIATTATSAAASYPVYPIGVQGPQTFVSFPEKGPGYYGTTTGQQTFALTNTPNFLGTVLLQGTLSLDPTATDWFDIDNGLFTYTQASPGYNAGSGLGFSMNGNGLRTDALVSTGLFAHTRAIVTCTQGTVMFINFNY
jgi:hypothetical protein